MIKVKVINKSNNPLPEYETLVAAGMDVRANITEPITIDPHQRCLITTGLFMKIPDGYEIQVRPRSGMALKHGITVLNTPGTIDADYTGEMGVILINTSGSYFTINPGDRVAQIVLKKVEKIEWEEVDELPKTERADGGFGHTGTK